MMHGQKNVKLQVNS